jgi:hypothetical protein
MKLKDWADKQGIAYLTAWRWFKAGDPRLANAYQSSSGTIIVPDETDFLEQPMVSNNQATEVMSLFLKKTVEFSKNNSSIEDFAAYILSTFSLKINYGPESPKYSKNKPKSEDIQKHFQQFIKPKGEKPKANMFVAEGGALDELVAKADNLTAQEIVSEVQKCGDEITDTEVSDLFRDLNNTTYTADNLPTFAEGLVSRTVDFNSTPQQINYTSSTTSLPLGIYAVSTDASSFITNNTMTMQSTVALPSFGVVNGSTSDLLSGQQYNYGGVPFNNINLEENPSADLWAATFKPTQKELAGASKVLEAPPATPRRRGRKPKAKP